MEAEPKTPLEKAVAAWNELADQMAEVLVIIQRAQRWVLVAALGMLTLTLAALIAITMMVWAIRGEVQSLIETQVRREAAYVAQKALRARTIDPATVEALERQVARSALESVKNLPDPPPSSVVDQLKNAVEKSPPPTTQ